jgi:copper chaperone NosL
MIKISSIWIGLKVPGPFLILMLILVLAASKVFGNEKPLKPSPKEKCPVCGMFVAKYPDFLAAIVFRDGFRVMFDGPKDMYKYYFEIKKYHPAKRPEDIESIYVTDYYTLHWIDGYQAWYVKGSDIYGPMGSELVPFGKWADAQEFQKDHKGQAVLRFKDVTRHLIRSLD